MLKIRDEQMAAFEETAEAAFAKSTVAYLRENHADTIVQLPSGKCKVAHLPDEVIYEMVWDSFQKAKAYGIDWQSTLRSFTVIRFIAAPNFDDHPIIKRLLKDENVPANERVDKLWENTTEQNWEAIEKNYNPEAWNLKPQEA